MKKDRNEARTEEGLMQPWEKIELEEGRNMAGEPEAQYRSREADIIKLQFCDLSGRMKSVEIPGRRRYDSGKLTSVEAEAVTGEIPELGRKQETGRKLSDKGQKNERKGKGGQGETVFLKPDWDTWLPMSWETGTGDAARVICQVTDRDGTPVWSDSREVLKRELLLQEKEGKTFRFGFGCEFFLFHTDEEGRATVLTHETAGYCDGGTIDLAESVRRDMILSLEEAGIRIESVTHGCAPGQHLFCLEPESGVKAADNLLAFRAIVCRIAKSHGLHASFMPRPFNGFKGSGLQIEVFPHKKGGEKEGRVLCRKGEERLKKTLGQMALVANPLVNSYGRLASFQEDGIGGEELVQSSGQALQFLLADSAANPYLLLAAVLAAGFREEREVKAVQEAPCLQEGLPATLGEAAAAFSHSRIMRELMGDTLFFFYRDLKNSEWKRYSLWVSDWELKEYLSRY